MRLSCAGKFFGLGESPFLLKGVTYGTFSPAIRGDFFPPLHRVADDFAMMVRSGINTVRTYTVPPSDILDEAARHGLRVMAGVPWSQHVAFLDDRRQQREIRQTVARAVKDLSAHPAFGLVALGNEIPAPVVRWHGRRKIETFLKTLHAAAKDLAPEAITTYVNYPPTEYLELPFFEVCAFNLYLHEPAELSAYLARLQHIAGHKPLLIAEAGADSLRHGEEGQASLTAMALRAAFTEGACGAVAFAWTDEWWRGGADVDDWAFGLVDSARRPKLALAAATHVFASAPFRDDQRRSWPTVSVVVCAYNAADTLEECLRSLEQLDYPALELILVDDGSNDATADIARRHRAVKVITTLNRGLSAARNVGLAAAAGEIVAYTDADVRVDAQWLTYLVQPFVTSGVAGSGGPNVVPLEDPWMAQCVARAPGGPTHVLLDDRTAEHVPGCNMAFRRDVLLSVGGFNPIYVRAGDDVDVCWRLQANGHRIGFAPAAHVWHHHRPSIAAYWRQQVGYGEGERWLMPQHPEKFMGRHVLWRGHVYSPLPFVRSLWSTRVNAGVWGTAAFPSVYRTNAHPLAYLPHSARWQVAGTGSFTAGGAAMLAGIQSISGLLMLAGMLALGVTLVKCLACARRSDISSLPAIAGRSLPWSRARYRATIALLHFLQPLARAYGHLRGVLSPSLPASVDRRAPANRRRAPSLGELVRCVQLMLGFTLRDRYWSESWVTSPTALAAIVERLRGSRAVKRILIDPGWWNDRDVSVPIGMWGQLHLQMLVEEHAQGRCLMQLKTRLRPTRSGVAVAATLTMVAVAWAWWPSLRQMWIGIALAAAVGGAACIVRAVATAQIVADVLSRAATQMGMLRLPRVVSTAASASNLAIIGVLPRRRKGAHPRRPTPARAHMPRGRDTSITRTDVNR